MSDIDDDDGRENGRAEARRIMHGHIAPSTRKLYASRMKAVTSFIREHYPMAYDKDCNRMKLPIDEAILEVFLVRREVHMMGSIKLSQH